MNEFELIARYFAPLSRDGLKDDAALLQVPQGFELAVSTDVLNEGVHFLSGAAPGNIARKALRVNLSDLAATGAKPLCYQLGLALPESCDEDWIAGFAAGLKEDQAAFGLFLSGGDTTRTSGPLSVSVTVMGLVPEKQAVRRGGAQTGDLIVLSGFVGDALIGLEVLRGALKTADDAYFIGRHRLPEPRVALIEALCAYGRAAADVSDGLVADLGHIAAASGLKAVIALKSIAFSPQARAVLESGNIAVEALLSGGDDYELIMALAPADFDAFQDEARKAGVSVQAIGHFETGSGVEVIDRDGGVLQFDRTGWRHF